MDNDDVNDILKQLETSNVFKSFVSPHYCKIVCPFSARVRQDVDSDGKCEYYWMTNEERRSLIRKLKSCLEALS